MLSWALYDWASNAFPTIVQTFLFASYFAGRVAPSETLGTTWWGLALGGAGLFVAFGAPFLGALCDQLGRRKAWIAGLTWLTVLVCGLLWFIKPSPQYVIPALLLVALGTVGSELSLVLYNAMLPSLVSRDQIGRWSGWGWGAGYLGGLACLGLALFGFVHGEGGWFGVKVAEFQHVRATFPMSAVWLFVFSLPLLLWTPDSPRADKTFTRAARDAVSQLRRSWAEVRQYMHIVRFLAARTCYVDGLATVFAFGGIYARGTFGMDSSEILGFGIGLNITAGLGAIGFGWVDDRIGGKRTVMIALVGLIGAGTALLLVHSELLFWGFAFLLGIFVGPVQAGSRSYLARIAPERLHNQAFGLYAFSGKATAFAGPFLVGWITHLSQSQRVGMSTVVVFFVVGLLLLLSLPRDVQAGRT
ncbi:MAG: MFS transporter [Planctomycetota bacterium]